MLRAATKASQTAALRRCHRLGCPLERAPVQVLRLLRTLVVSAAPVEVVAAVCMVVRLLIVAHDCLPDLVQALLHVDELVLVVVRNEPVELVDEVLLPLEGRDLIGDGSPSMRSLGFILGALHHWLRLRILVDPCFERAALSALLHELRAIFLRG